ncbi:MAG: hypothetical protein HY539_02635 [Deltaproteobacteria bacterium]|nr:hypothetical protein [Deltaproteobacteria bacterium]
MMRKTWFTLGLFVSFLLMPAAELWAINWSEFMRDDRMFVGAEITQINDWRLPEGCRRESLSPNDDEVEEEDCERIICDGHFWGESAIDVCCAEEVTTEGEGEEAPAYKRCHVREPRFSSTSGGWRQVRFQTRGIPRSGCGTHVLRPTEAEETTSLVDLLLSSAYAHPGSRPSDNPIPWSYEERLLIANSLSVAADRIEYALTSGDTSEVGTEGSQFRGWIEDAFLVSRFLGHTLSPVGFPACPPELLGLCDFIGHQVDGYWANLSLYLLGETHHLNSFIITADFAVELNPAALGLALNTISHEATHIVFHWGRGLYADPTAPGFDYDFIMSTDPVLNYEDEMTARIVGAIVYHFLADSVRNESPEEWNWLAEHYGGSFDDMARDPEYNASNSMPDSYVETFFWQSLTDEQRAEVLECMDWGSRYGAITSDNEELYLQWLVYCIGETLGETNAAALLNELHNRLMGQGGGEGFGESAGSSGGTGAVFDLAEHPAIHHDYVDSPETETSPGGSSEGEPPPSDFDWHHPGNFTEDPNDPNYEPPNTSNHIPPECVGTFGVPEVAGASVPASCFDWCWNHFSRGRDGGICQQMSDRDLESGCTYSTGDQCEEENEQRLDDCNTDASFRNSEFCQEACGSSGTPAHCDELCASNRSLPFCDNICGRNHTYGFCGDICHNDNNSHGFCQDRCVDNPGRPYCDNICVTNRSLSFCDDTCSRNRSYSYCDDLCVSNPGLSFCDDFCSENSSLGFCDDVCRRNNSYAFCESFCDANPNLDFCAPPTESFRGWECNGPWVSRGSRTLWEHWMLTNCYPYVGPVRCCGTPTAEMSELMSAFGISGELCLPETSGPECNARDYCGCGTHYTLADSANCCIEPGSGTVGYFACDTDFISDGIDNVAGCNCYLVSGCR